MMSQAASGIVLLFALFTGTVNTECSNVCTYCENFRCMECQSLYYLVNGKCWRCPENCATCNYYKCTSCKPHKWGLAAMCSYSCSTNCLSRECEDYDGYCTRCMAGTYGAYCQRNCSVCQDDQCDLRKCTFGCKPGYYEIQYDSPFETICRYCDTNCVLCESQRLCKECNDGYYLYEFSQSEDAYCYPCPIGKNCKTCKRQREYVACTACYNGFQLDGEKNCKQRLENVSTCSSGCSSACDENGVCSGSCYAGWTGEKCTDLCPTQCLRCDKRNAYLCKECNGEFYTSTCKVKCNASCLKISGQTTCGIHDGYCLNGCEKNVWGPSCNISCSKQCVDVELSKVCERDNGTCIHGCIKGYDGDMCNNPMTTKPKDESVTKTRSKIYPTAVTTTNEVFRDETTGKTVQKSDSKAIIVGAGAGGGAIMLILTVILVLCYLKRRHKSKSDRLDKGSMSNTVTFQGTSDDIPDKTEQENVEMQDYIYAQPNKPKTAKKPSEKETSKTQNVYDNIVVDLEDDKIMTKETNVGKFQLEHLDEGPISFIDTEVKVPTADTYYNTASLIRSRIQISNLLEYITMKMDYEQEFEKLSKGLTRPCTEALKPGNISKNRYNGVYAYDATRVKLESQNYVNANYIDGHRKFPEYIASLGPTSGAMKFETFWEMIWQERTEKIVMLTHLEESGKMKCEQYWPDQGETNRYSDHSVTCTSEKEFSEFVVREFTISRGSETRRVDQYHYLAWPDKTVPDTAASLMEFRDKVEQKHTTEAGPMLVHCSAGIGRTGTYIALDTLIREGREEGFVDIFGRVAALRGQRAHMVQNPEQYRFLHHCVMYALTCDSQPLSKSAIEQVMTVDKISAQYRTFLELQITTRTDRKTVAECKNRKENRNGADTPADENRVRLTFMKHDYINAVHLNGYLKADEFILAQTPLPNTLEDFVSMLYQEECPCVVCLDEENLDDKTVGQYLPPANKVARYGQFQVACTRSNSTEDFVTRELKISRSGLSTTKEACVLHYQFRGWGSSKKVPVSARSLLNLVSDIKEASKHRGSEHPIVVHCLTGAERSGLFCGVFILLEKLSIEKELSVINTVCQVRCRRPSAFQDTEQLQFCCECVKETLEISESNIYYNA